MTRHEKLLTQCATAKWLPSDIQKFLQILRDLPKEQGLVEYVLLHLPKAQTYQAHQPMEGAPHLRHRVNKYLEVRRCCAVDTVWETKPQNFVYADSLQQNLANAYVPDRVGNNSSKVRLGPICSAKVAKPFTASVRT